MSQGEPASQRRQSPSSVAVVEKELKHQEIKVPDIGLNPQPFLTADHIRRMPASISEEVFNETSAEKETCRLLAFLLGEEEYGINILMVREIIRLTEITPVPRAPACIKGIISLRGTVLPILNFHQLLSMPETRPDKKNRILVVNLEAGPVGVIVDAVTGVVDLKEAELEPPPAVATGLATGHIKGIGRYKGRLIILLEPDKVYSTRQGQMSGRAGPEGQTLP